MSPSTRNSSPAVLPLDELDGEGFAAQAGGKALRLARLRGLGLPAPDGFVLLARAFQADGSLQDEARDDALGRFRALIEQAGAVAVRSSGSAEDAPQASYAGQFKTILGVASEEDFLSAATEVWSSYRDPGAQAYRAAREEGAAEQAGPVLQVGGVLVQPLVHARTAGVAFTCDPVTGGADELVINAAWGLGEGVVQGEVIPELIRVARDGLQETARWAAGQDEERVYAGDRAGMRVVRRPIEAERRNAPVLDPEQTREVARMALRCEELLGGLQDVEWAFDPQGRLVVLQSRPVTASAGWKPQAGFALGAAQAGRGELPGTWTSANSGEALPDPVSPLTWSLMTPLIEDGRREAFQALGVQDPPGQYMRLFLGRPYFNLDYFRAFLRDVPGVSEDLFDALIFTERVDRRTLKLLVPVWDRRYFRIVRLAAAHGWRAGERLDHFVPILDHLLASRVPPELEGLTDDDLLRLAGRLRRLIGKGFRLHVLGTAMAGASFLLLARVLARWLPDGGADHALESGLLAGVSGVSSAEQGYALADLASVAGAHTELAHAILQDPSAAVLPRLAELDGGQAFLRRLDDFLEVYGHQGAGEADLLYPRWTEDPTGILSAVAGYLRSGTRPARGRDRERLRQRREREARRLGRQLHRHALTRGVFPLNRWIGWFRRSVFRVLFRLAVAWAPYRENLRFSTLRAFLPLRRCYRELGSRLARTGSLDCAEDVYFLEAGEVEDLLHGRLDPQAARERVRARTERRRVDLAVTPPPFFVGDRPGWVVPRREDGALTGVPASGGVATGTARILTSPDQGHLLRRGDILVAPQADPAWTPLFLLAGGLVLEVGGVLSHAAVVAREYGLPCVVGVRMATRLIQDGSPVTVDGTRGRVITG